MCLQLTQQEAASERTLQIGALARAIADSSLPVAEEAAAALIALCHPLQGMSLLRPAVCVHSVKHLAFEKIIPFICMPFSLCTLSMTSGSDLASAAWQVCGSF